jgi:pimeloyl-ACP methyl ester carboxylesterase
MKLLSKKVIAVACSFAFSLSAGAAVTESFLEAPTQTGHLKGTFLSPESKPAYVVLIIPGSGPTDRDGNNPAGVKASTYRLLAEGLASQGVASLRFDKRGMFASATATPDGNSVTVADYVGDVRSWVTVLQRETGAPCVWVLGHSEGGLVALAAAQGQTNICGLILVATAGRPMGQVLRDQLKANPGNAPILSQAMAAIDTIESGRRVDIENLHPALQKLFNPSVQGFLVSLFSFDPVKLIAGISKPILALQGQSDIQIGEADAGLLIQHANPQSKLAILPNVNHVLKTVKTKDRQENLATYSDPGLPLAPRVVDAITAFLKGSAGTAGK